jgi:hypothetical protein
MPLILNDEMHNWNWNVTDECLLVDMEFRTDIGEVYILIESPYRYTAFLVQKYIVKFSHKYYMMFQIVLLLL